MSIEDVRKFWDERPCNVRHSSKEIGSMEYFDEVEKKKFFVEPHIVDFMSFSEWNGKKVLEVGCGLATAGVNFARCGAHYTGVELSEKTLDLAKKRFEVYGLNGNFYLANAETLSDVVPIEEYDLICSFGVIHHTPQPNKVIEQLQLFMGAHSKLKIMLYAKNSWKSVMIEAGFDQPEAQYGCPIANTYTHEEVVELLRPLRVESIVQDHIFPYQIEPYKKGQYVKQPWFESMPTEMFRTLERRLGWHLNITASK